MAEKTKKADINLRERKNTMNADDEPAQDPTTTEKQAQKKAKKYPCGKCNEEVKMNVNSLRCQTCEFWFHYDCVDGMTKEYFDNCRVTYEVLKFSSFLCKVCRKVVAKFNQSLKEVHEEVAILTSRIGVLEQEKKVLEAWNQESRK